MAGIGKRASSSSSSSGDGFSAVDRLRPVTRKRRSAGRGARGAARRPAASAAAAGAAARRENELDLNRAVIDPDHHAAGLRVILQKELRNSDVSQLGRIILPKKEAEAYMPVLTSKDGRTLSMQDLLNGQMWTFKYRYWPNNKSRMYVLENTGDYVRTHALQLGDFIMIYKNDENNRFVIGAKKAGSDQFVTVPQVVVPACAPPVDENIPATAPQVDELSARDIIVSQADENHEIYDGILNSLPEIPVANVRYSDFFDPFDDGMGIGNPLNDAPSIDLAPHFHDEKAGASSFASPKPGPHI